MTNKLIILLCLFSALQLKSAPIKYEVNVIEGTVHDAIWRDKITLRKVFISQKNKENTEKVTNVAAHFDLVLEHVKDVDKNILMNITHGFLSNPPIDNFSRFVVYRNIDQFNEGRKLYLRLHSEKPIDIHIGSKVKILNLKLIIEGFVTDVSIEKFFIDGLEVRL